MSVAESFKNTKTFIDECWIELQKVTWPDRDQLQQATLVVILFTMAVSLIIWGMDSVVSFILRQIMAISGA